MASLPFLLGSTVPIGACASFHSVSLFRFFRNWVLALKFFKKLEMVMSVLLCVPFSVSSLLHLQAEFLYVSLFPFAFLKKSLVTSESAIRRCDYILSIRILPTSLFKLIWQIVQKQRNVSETILPNVVFNRLLPLPNALLGPRDLIFNNNIVLPRP